jgi:hypothetical protein
MNGTTTLRAWLDQAWNDHPTAARRVADELAERAAALPDDATGAEALRLAEHVLLAHLADLPALHRLLSRVPAGDALTPTVQRARWALAMLEGAPPPDVPERARWSALQNVVLVHVARGEMALARERLLADEAAVAAHPDKATQTAYASTANNVALDLRVGLRGDAARDALMIDAAQLSRRAWTRAGTWLHSERADYQLAMCHAVLGQGALAVAAADACLQRCEAEGAEPGELFFAHECNVHAQRAAANTAAAAQHRERMVALLEQVSDAGTRQWCSETLATT